VSTDTQLSPQIIPSVQSHFHAVHPLNTSRWTWTPTEASIPYKCLDYRNDLLKECFTVKWDIILVGYSQAESKFYTCFGIKVSVYMYSAHQQRAPCVRSERAHTYKKRKDERGVGGRGSPTLPRWSQSMEPSSYQLTPVACSQPSRGEGKKGAEGRAETGHWFRVRRLSWALISTSLSITPLTLLSRSLYFNLSIIPLICVAFLPSAFAKGQITWKGRKHLNRSQIVSSMKAFVCVCVWERDRERERETF